MSIDLPAYNTEFEENLQHGAFLMENMVRESIFDGGQIPPKEFLDWYVDNAAYRFIQAEHRHINETPNTEGVEAGILELTLIFAMLGKTKQFGLTHHLSQVLRTRSLRLPTGYDITMGGRLPL